MNSISVKTINNKNSPSALVVVRWSMESKGQVWMEKHKGQNNRLWLALLKIQNTHFRTGQTNIYK